MKEVEKRDYSHECVNCGTVVIRKPSFWKRIKGLACCSKQCRAEYLKLAYLGNSNPNKKKMDTLTRWFDLKCKAVAHSAKQRGLDFNLTLDYLMELYRQQNGLCYYTSIPLQMSVTPNWEESKCAAPDILSVDRIDSSLGYMQGNIVLCCTAINKMKGNYPAHFLHDMFGYIIAKHMNSCHAKIKKLNENAIIPTRSSLGDVGYDLYVSWFKDQGEFIDVGTGIAIQPNVGWYFEAAARSSLHKKGLMLYNSIGIIDNSYQGEIVLKLFKTRQNAEVKIGERVAQLLARRYAMVELKEVTEFDNREIETRSTSGFGSTGQ